MKISLPKNLNFYESITAWVWVFGAFCLAFAFFGILNLWAVLGAVVAASFTLYALRGNCLPGRRASFIFLIVALFGAGFMLVRGFYIGDVYYHWLPFARELALSGSLPEFVNFNWFSIMPLQTLLFAASFILTGSLNQFINLWVPVLFTGATFIVLLDWAKFYNFQRKYLWFLGILFFANAGVQWWGTWNLMQEPLVLFFATLFLYYFDRLRREPSSHDLVIFLTAGSLMALSKFNGIFLLLLLVPAFLVYPDKKRFLLWTLFLFSPFIFWLARNYSVYGNPVFPVLNSFFGGPFSEYYSQVFTFSHHQFSPYSTLISKLKFSFTDLLGEFPYLLIAVYGLVKLKRWSLFSIFAIYFFVKEIFLFSATSGTRYYYVFFTLFVLFGLLGLQKISGKHWLAALWTLALVQVLSILPVDSTSDFISRFETVFAPIYPTIIFAHEHNIIISLILGFLVYLFLDQEQIKDSLVYLYGMFVFKLKFLANKTWLAVYPAFSTAIVLPFALKISAVRRYVVSISVLVLAFFIFLNTYVMGAAYYLKKGSWEFPVQHIYESSIWSKSVLDKATNQENLDNFYILIFANRDYFIWFTDYQAVTYTDFDFLALTKTYDKSMPVGELKQLLVDSKIKYIAINQLHNDLDYSDFANLTELVRYSEEFQLLAESQEGYSVWQVY